MSPTIAPEGALTAHERAYRRFALRLALSVGSALAGVVAAVWWLL